MRFRTVLLVGILALVSAVLLVTVLAVSFLVDRSARRDVAAGLQRSQDVLAEHFSQRQALLRTESRVVAEEPRLKAVVATEEVTHETVLGVALELRRALQSDVFLMTDAHGQLLADVADPSATGFDMSKNPLIAAAFANGEATSVLTDDRGIYQMQARRLAFGATTVGTVAIGYRLNDKAAESAARQTASGVLFQVDGKTLAVGGVDVTLEESSASLGGVPTGGGPVETVLKDRRYLAVALPVAGYAGSHAVRYVLVRSLDDALAARGELLRALYLIFVVAAIGAALLAVRLSSRLATPLAELVSFTKEISRGSLDKRASVTGAVELTALGDAMNEMVTEIGEGREKLAASARIAREMELAARIQTSMVPRDLKAPNLEIAASMRPATEVGGDYYDVLPVDGGCWLAIGDVAGHGLKAGIVMMMIQGIVAALVRALPAATPSTIVKVLNSVVYQNIRERLRQDEHVTLSLLKYSADGRVDFAGAHEEMLLCRAGGCERIPTPGMWIGAAKDISEFTKDRSFQLNVGDVLVLYTDGVIEGRDASGLELGLDRVAAVVEASRELPVDEMRRLIVELAEGWAVEINDDITVVVIRYAPA